MDWHDPLFRWSFYIFQPTPKSVPVRASPRLKRLRKNSARVLSAVPDGVCVIAVWGAGKTAVEGSNGSHATDVVGDGYQHPFGLNVYQPPSVKPSKTTLLFEDSEYRFYDGLPFLVDLPPSRASELVSHALVFGVSDWASTQPLGHFAGAELVL